MAAVPLLLIYSFPDLFTDVCLYGVKLNCHYAVTYKATAHTVFTMEMSWLLKGIIFYSISISRFLASVLPVEMGQHALHNKISSFSLEFSMLGSVSLLPRELYLGSDH